MTILEVTLAVQLIVSPYLTRRVRTLQEEIEGPQMVVGSILMDQPNKEAPKKL